MSYRDLRNSYCTTFTEIGYVAKGMDRCSINCEAFEDDGSVLRLIGKAGVDVHKQVVLWCRKGERYNFLIS